MKPVSFLLLSLLAYSSCTNSSAAINLDNEQDVKKALSNKWEAAYMETVGLRNEVPEPMVTHTELFKNGSYSRGVKNGVLIKKGSWAYDPGNHTLIYTTDHGKFSSRIIKLSGKELITAEYLIMNDQVRDSTIYTYRKI